jgi:hypothetical protein
LVNTQSDPGPAFAAIGIDHLNMERVWVEGSSSLPGLPVKGVKQLKAEKVKVLNNR